MNNESMFSDTSEMQNIYGYMPTESFLMNTSDLAVVVHCNYSFWKEIVWKRARPPSDNLSIHLPFSMAICVITWQAQINVKSHSNRPHFLKPTDTIRFVLLFNGAGKVIILAGWDMLYGSLRINIHSNYRKHSLWWSRSPLIEEGAIKIRGPEHLWLSIAAHSHANALCTTPVQAQRGNIPQGESIGCLWIMEALY